MCENITMRPIGTMRSVFHYKNGTPRQSSLCEAARGILTIDKSIFNNPEHSLEGLEQFSHAWIIFVFHKNNNVHTKAKVKPPRLDGHRVGVFSTRSPYRPNNIGLSLAKIDRVQGSAVHFSGIDLLDGTPVLDIKPYIPEYDKPKDSFSLMHSEEMKDVLAAGHEMKDVLAAGHEMKDVLAAGHEMKDVFAAGNEMKDVLAAGNEMKDVLAAGNEMKDVLAAGHEMKDVLAAGHEMKDVLAAGHEMKDVLAAGHEMKDVLAAGHEMKSTVDNTDIPKHSSSKVQEIKFNTVCDGDVGTAGNKYCLDFNIKDDLIQQIVNESSIHHVTDSSIHHVTDSNMYHVTDSSIHHVTDSNIHHVTDSSIHHVTDSSIHHVTDSAIQSFNNSGIVGNQDAMSCENKAFSNQNNKSSLALRQKGRCSGEAIHKTNTETFSSVVAPWLLNPPVVKLSITFTCEALDQLNKFSQQSSDPDYRLQMFIDADEAKTSIAEIIQEDPRSVYRRQHCQDSLYYFNIDVLHVTCWFDNGKAQVIRVKPVTLVPKLTQMSANEKLQVQGH